MKKWGICFLLGLGCFHVKAQQYSIRQYMILDGLPQSQVNMTLEDAYGYLWLATYGGGLARFDGRDFKVYTTHDGLLSNVVSSLMLDSKQNIWAVHPKGVTRFDGYKFKKFSQPTSPSRIRRIFEFRDSVYIVDRQGMIGKISNDSVYYWSKPIRENKMILLSHLLPTKDICLYLNDSSFLVKTGKEEFTLSHQKDFGRLYNIFNQDKEVILATDKGYFVLDYLHRKIYAKGLDIANKILLYDKATQSFWTYASDNVLKEYYVDGKHKIDTVIRNIPVPQVFPDAEGNVWFGSSGKGLFKYFAQDFERFPLNKPDGVMSMEKDRDGSFWVGSMFKGLWKIKNGSEKKYDLKGIYENNISSIRLSPQGELWVSMFGGIGKYNREKDSFQWFTRKDGLPSTYVNQVDFDADGNVWYATFGGGAGYYNHRNFKNFTVNEGLSGKNMMTVKYSPYYQTVFVGGDNGLDAIKNDKVTTVPIPEFENSAIHSINLYKEKWLLLGSGGAGIVVYNPEDGNKVVIDTRKGLPSDFVYFVAADKEDQIWIGTEKGISKIKLSETLSIEENLHFGYENGLIGLETNQNSFYLGDEKCFGLVDGLYRYNDLSRAGWHSFGLHLTDIEIFNGQFNVRDCVDSLSGFFKIPVNLSLPSDKNHVTFHFNRVDKRYPKSVHFKYILENFDKTWSMPSTTAIATYGNLPPGEYTFKVKSTDSKGSWSNESLVYSFVIRRPFYQTAAFQIAVLLSPIVLIGLIIYIRFRNNIRKMIQVQRIRQEEQDSLRKEIARDFHDEMGNQLTRIINYISLMKLNGNGNGSGLSHNHNKHELYNKVEESAKYLYTGTRDFIWSIDPVNDELSKLFIHIRDFGEKLFTEKGISFRAYNEIKTPIYLPYGFSREVNLIFKEAMTNAFNHSKASNVSFTLKEEADEFVMSLRDDGCGFNLSEAVKLNGVKNMTNRAERVRSSLQIESSSGSGTIVVLSFSNIKNKNYGITI
jgi:ligand-binding sensor domain-containing protein/signal transduction histidine kinase